MDVDVEVVYQVKVDLNKSDNYPDEIAEIEDVKDRAVAMIRYDIEEGDFGLTLAEENSPDVRLAENDDDI